MPTSHKALNGNPFKNCQQGGQPGSATVSKRQPSKEGRDKTVPFGIPGSNPGVGVYFYSISTGHGATNKTVLVE
jgi:hypothetical protein